MFEFLSCLVTLAELDAEHARVRAARLKEMLDAEQARGRASRTGEDVHVTTLEVPEDVSVLATLNLDQDIKVPTVPTQKRARRTPGVNAEIILAAIREGAHTWDDIKKYGIPLGTFHPAMRALEQAGKVTIDRTKPRRYVYNLAEELPLVERIIAHLTAHPAQNIDEIAAALGVADAKTLYPRLQRLVARKRVTTAAGAGRRILYSAA